jgi:hypothetical protein
VFIKEGIKRFLLERKNVQEMAIEDTQRHIVELTWRLVKKTQRE